MVVKELFSKVQQHEEQCGRGEKTRSFSEDVSNQLTPLLSLFRSEEKPGLLGSPGAEVVFGVNCNSVCVCVWVECEVGDKVQGGKALQSRQFFLCCRAFQLELLAE